MEKEEDKNVEYVFDPILCQVQAYQLQDCLDSDENHIIIVNFLKSLFVNELGLKPKFKNFLHNLIQQSASVSQFKFSIHIIYIPI